MEMDKTKQQEEQIDQLELKLIENRNSWNKKITILSNKIAGDIKDCIMVEAEALSYRQIVNDEIAKNTYQLIKLNSKLKNIHKAKFEFYATKYQIKTNSGEKNKLIDADMSWFVAKMDLIDSYITFLSESRKTIDHVIWSIKNRIEIYNITGLD